mmetsp:Transcript_3324/g.11678  ORF Transcript_3324/g.11678 Transcript_3324/m.11678 type:complete len:231 (-) Transcript_3324:50-742(-)
MELHRGRGGKPHGANAGHQHYALVAGPGGQHDRHARRQAARHGRAPEFDTHASFPRRQRPAAESAQQHQRNAGEACASGAGDVACRAGDGREPAAPRVQVLCQKDFGGGVAGGEGGGLGGGGLAHTPPRLHGGAALRQRATRGHTLRGGTLRLAGIQGGGWAALSSRGFRQRPDREGRTEPGAAYAGGGARVRLQGRGGAVRCLPPPRLPTSRQAPADALSLRHFPGELR